MRAPASIVTVLLLSTSSVLGFENLVANGQFDSHVAYFSLRLAGPGDTMDWDSEDSSANPVSGSMAVTEADGNGVVFGSQCIPVLGGNEYHFGGDMKIQTGTGATQILLQQFSGIVCSSGFISNFNNVSIAVGVWTPADEIAALDPTARSVLLGGWFDNYTTNPATAKFDGFYLYSQTVVFFDHFEYGDLLQWDQWVP